MNLSNLVLLSGLATLTGAVLSVFAGSQPIAQQSNVLPLLAPPVPQQQMQQRSTAPSYPQLPPASAPVVPSATVSSPLPSVHPSQEQRLKTVSISSCNGQEGNATFRSASSISPAVVLGVVPKGDFVYLTNKTAFGDSLTWYEAIAPHELRQNNNPSATNQDTRAGQTGWIAACFVNH